MAGNSAWHDIKGSPVLAKFSYSPELKNLVGSQYLPLRVEAPGGGDLGGVSGRAELARNYVQQGEPEKALAEIEEAEEVAKTGGDAKVQASLFDVKGAAYMLAGEFEKAIDVYRQAMVLERSQNDLNAQAEMFLRIAWANQSKRDAKNALNCYEAARSFFEQSGNKEGVIRARLGIRSLQQTMGEVNYLLSKVDWVKAGSTPEQAARVMAGDAHVLMANSDAVQAYYLYKEALPLLASSSDAALQGAVLTGAGQADSVLGFSDEATQRLEAARSKFPAGNREAQAAVLASLGDAKLSMAFGPAGVNEKLAAKAAMKWYDEALPLMRATGNRSGEIGVLAGIGAAHEMSKDSDAALASYLQALSIVEELALSERLQEYRSSSAGQTESLYAQAVAIAMKEHKREEAFNLTERARATSFLLAVGNEGVGARLHLAPEFAKKEQDLRNQCVLLDRQLGQELAKLDQYVNEARVVRLRMQQDAIRREYQGLARDLRATNAGAAPYLSVFPLTLVEVQSRLDADTTLVSYFAASDKPLAFVVTKTELKAVELHPKLPEFTDALETLPGMTSATKTSATLSLLYKTLIAPIRGDLKTKALIVVPDEELMRVPFAALSSDGSHYLGEDYVMRRLPSASSLAYTRKAEGVTINQMLILVASRLDSQMLHEATAGEAVAVAKLYGTEPLLSGDSTVTLLRDEGTKSDVVHILTRTGAQPDSNFSITVPQVAGTDLTQTSLVVLSGRQAANKASLEVLSQAFLYAGAQTVMTSLWDVDPDGTEALMIAFYTHLKARMSGENALRTAQLEVRKKYPQPYYWAGFVLTGAPSN
jgi:CHAT domain-containing protein